MDESSRGAITQQLVRGLFTDLTDTVRVLMVEDSEADAAIVRERLRDIPGHAFEVTWVATVAAARPLLASEAIDAVILDLNLPDSAGVETVREIRALAPRAPLVVLTGETEDLDGRMVSVRAGADDYISKEEPASKLLARSVLYAIERHRTRNRAEQLTALIRSSPDAVLVVDQGRNVLFANLATETLFGNTRQALLGLPLALEVRQSQAGISLCAIESTAAGTRQVEVREVDIHWESAACRLVILRDVTDRLRVEERLRAVQKLEAIGRLSSGVAHEINNVLTTIYACANAIQEAEPEHGVLEDVSEIVRAANRASTLVQQLMAVSRERAIQPSAVSLDAVTLGVARVLQRTLGADVELDILMDEDLWPVWSDRGQLEQVLLNLALNARDAMPEGGKLTISASNEWLADTAGLEGDFVHLTVHDDGLGMHPSVLEKVFEPFFTTKANGKGGLGLPVCQGIVRQIGGDLRIESELGSGCTVHVYLPHAPALTEPTKKRSGEYHSLRGSETVLVVDDDTLLRSRITLILRGQGYVVLDASNGAEAAKMLDDRDGFVNLVLTDRVMPQMGGAGLLDHVRRCHPATSVVVMSGHPDPDPRLSGPDVSLLAKPFQPRHLLQHIRAVLDAIRGH